MHDILKEEIINNFKITFRKNYKNSNHELVIKHLDAGGHFSIHNKVQLLDTKGSFLDMVNIQDVDVAQLFNNIEKYGTT